MAIEPVDPLRLFSAVFGLSSFAGLASLLRSGRPVSPLAIASAMLNSVLLGLGIFLLWYNYFRSGDNILFLVGVCLFAGLGGATVLDFIAAASKNGGINIKISAGDSDADDRS